MYNVNYALEFKVTYFNLLIRNSNDHRVLAIFTRVPIPKPFVQFCRKKKLFFLVFRKIAKEDDFAYVV